MIDLKKLQARRQVWALRNFGPDPKPYGHQNVLGVCAEAGELAHAQLKLEQNIRGDRDEHLTEIADAVGDICMYLMGVCDNYGFVFEECIRQTAESVMRRDWVADPERGGEALPTCPKCGCARGTRGELYDPETDEPPRRCDSPFHDR